MFGGVEQLLRDSSDWVFQDQASLAFGLGNWGLATVSSSGGGGGGGAQHWPSGLGNEDVLAQNSSASPPWTEVGMSPASVSAIGGYDISQGQGQTQNQNQARAQTQQQQHQHQQANGQFDMIGLGGPGNNMSPDGMNYEESWYQ